MSEDVEEEKVAAICSQLTGFHFNFDESNRARPPNKKKYEEDTEKLISQIREKEAALERMKSSGNLNIKNELTGIKSEKTSVITKRKQIDADLEKLKKVIPEKMRQLGHLESSLSYKNEDKINAAIQRLEWNLKVQPFKLNEEKKIVSEIDRLKRSKKTLVQFSALRQEIAAIRENQRSLRERRDSYFQLVGRLNSDEERIRRDSTSTKMSISALKSQIDELYETKRQLVAIYKKQLEEFHSHKKQTEEFHSNRKHIGEFHSNKKQIEEFPSNKKHLEESQGVKEKPRRGSWKKREDCKQPSINNRRPKRHSELDVDRLHCEQQVSWCNSLIRVLSRYNHWVTQDLLLDNLSPVSNVESGLIEEIEDGQYVLLKKHEEDLECAAKKTNKRNRKPRKISSLKKVTLSPDMVQQLSELGLKAPNSVADIPDTIESLKYKKASLERELHLNEVASEAGISGTESMICEISRQGSKTESYEGTADTYLGEQVYAEILKGTEDDRKDAYPEGWDDEGAVGGEVEVFSILSPLSDSTVDGDSGSNESASVGEHVDSQELSSSVGLSCETQGRGNNCLCGRPAEPSETITVRCARCCNLSAQSKFKAFSRTSPSNTVTSGGLGAHRPRDDVDLTFQPVSEISGSTELESRNCQKQDSVNLNALGVCSTKQEEMVSPPSQNDSTSNFSFSLATARNTSLDATKTAWSMHMPVTGPVLPELVFDSEEFPSLSQSLSQQQPRRGSNLCLKSSANLTQHHLVSQSGDCHSSSPPANQNQGLELMSHMQHPKHVFPVNQSSIPQVKEKQQVTVHIAVQNLPENLSVSQIPSVDASSTEKWVECSVAFVKDFSRNPNDADATLPVSESIRL